MWKLLADSVRGAAHVTCDHPCQDYGFASRVTTSEGGVLLAACADGAGSADHADAGARLAAATVVQAIAADLHAGLTVSDVDRVRWEAWFAAARSRLLAEAERRTAPPRQLASTLLVAVVGPRAAAFAQIGDGAIVARDGGDYRPVFWPQSGEVANSTRFLTDADAIDRFVATVGPRTDEVALFTDGLQPLALRVADKSANAAFFRPLFAALRGSQDGELAVPLRQFLQSPGVSSRTDDDRTLILATRRPAGPAG